MTDLNAILHDAHSLQQAGRFGEAEALYRHLLEQAPDAGEIHFLLGCLLVRAGRQADGLPALTEAARLLPHLAEPQIVLGNTLISLQRWNEAVETLTHAVMLKPGILPVMANLALALLSCGRNAEAELVYSQILESDANNLEAHNALAYFLNGERRFEEAERHARVAVDLAPANAAGLNMLGNSLYGLRRLEEAEQAYLRAIAVGPSQPQTHLNLYGVYRDQKRTVEAEQAARSALQIAPNSLHVLDAVAGALMDLDCWDGAVDCLERAIRLDPSSAFFHRRIAYACSYKGSLEDAVAYGRKSMDLAPSPEAQSQLAWDQLRTGRYVEGWKNLFLDDLWTDEARRRAGPPAWDGSPLHGRALLVYAEGGLGDTIQFVRFLPLVMELTHGPVVFQCMPQVIDLLRGMPGLDNIVMQGVDHPILQAGFVAPPMPVEYQVSLLRLPALFGTTEETIPTGLLALHVSEEASASWRSRLAGLGRLRVGLCWAGSPTYKDDRYRSMQLAGFAPLAAVDGAAIVSLQAGPPADEIRSACHGLDILHVPEDLSPITKTAGLLRELDLVISVDTSIAHLAGSLGVETWLLLPFVSHWVWNAYRPNDTPWYPRHRLFRQACPGDWTTVVHRVAQCLAARVESSGGGAASCGHAEFTESPLPSQ